MWEKCTYDQICAYSNSILFNAQYGFKRTVSTQDSIDALVGKLTYNLDGYFVSRVFFMDSWLPILIFMSDNPFVFFF